MSAQPNILYINSHDTGRYIQPYGYAIPTANIQRLAEGGVLFRQCFTVNPTCSPSRAALLTGTYPHENGMLGLAHRGFQLSDYRHHLLHTLKENGYETLLAGHQHIFHGPNPDKEIGYDRFLGDHKEDKGLNAAVQFLKERKSETPFYLELGFTETHLPFPKASALDDERYMRPPTPLPDVPETRRAMSEFASSARILDQKMGMIFDALEEADLAGNTLVICTTDHGIPFPNMKCNLTDHGLGVMLIMRGPGGFNGGKIVDAMVSHLDIFPTVCDLIGAKLPDRLRGKSLLPLMKGHQDRIHEEVFAGVNWHACFEPMRSVRTERYKYIRRYSDRKEVHRPNIDGYAYIKTWKENGFDERQRPSEELYDLIFDPNEACNIADHAAMTSVLKDMKARLEKWQKETGDPLFQGNLIPPVGMLACRCDAEHAKAGVEQWDGKKWSAPSVPLNPPV